MPILKIIALLVLLLSALLVIALYVFQTRLIFYPGKLSRDFRFKAGEEVFLKTSDGEHIHGLFYRNRKSCAILYFHGNAGDLRGWQYVSEDFYRHGYSVFLIDYRGYGKSSGSISEKGFYLDAEAAFTFLTQRGFTEKNILIYGRSIGSGVATELASRHSCGGLILEAPYTSLGKLANEKIPFFFPSLYLKYKFNNLEKINRVKCPVLFIHGDKDELIPAAHTETLFKHFTGKKKKVIIAGGAHNDLIEFSQYEDVLSRQVPGFFRLE